ncbi:hypothetical protein FEM48_Zijuj01G0303200 [Ziziphus jujuba var. spinosa]|uniref:MAPK kinase substrate protein At1g80180-like n=1 Tax=Ziziphus jujuba var. spinosa TaxID=714518 RepID=A0A978W5Z2_ZIZJJ|nr:hypothetical protein FEM48_Zijuj01G0303200 [Ziziphus jujuba var. spinosa]
MAGLQRSAVSFRRQGSSGLVWDDKFLAAEVKKKEEEDARARAQAEAEAQGEETEKPEIKAPKPINTIDRSRSNGGGRGYRTGRVSPAIEPPSPKVSACGFCSAFAIWNVPVSLVVYGS